MNDSDIMALVILLHTISAKHDRRQRFDWETRHLSLDEKRRVEGKIKARWNEVSEVKA